MVCLHFLSHKLKWFFPQIILSTVLWTVITIEGHQNEIQYTFHFVIEGPNEFDSCQKVCWAC